VGRLNDRKEIGIFVTGQSIFDKPASKVNGAVGDRTLANYKDFEDIVGHLSRATSPLICITGDVHWGRVIQVRNRTQGNRVAMYEIITSPSSLVATVGSDQLHDAAGFLGGLFGRDNPWPRHSQPDMSPGWHGRKGANAFQFTTIHGHRGDQVAVLSLRRFGAGVQARVGFFNVHADPNRRTRSWSEPFDLGAGIDRSF
jgi:hypothetical protein